MMRQIAASRRPFHGLMAVACLLVACGSTEDGTAPTTASTAADRGTVFALPAPTLHHLHINAVDPERSLDWWETVWPAGETTTVAGFRAFAADGIFHLYTEVDTQAPGAFDPARQRSVPQSPFWTTGPSTDGLVFYERLTTFDPEGERFAFLPVYTGPDDDAGVPHSGLAPYGDRLLTVAELEALAGTPPERGPDSQDFGYLVDPDGILLEFNGNAETDDIFHGHLHFWHEAPYCAVNWYVEHLGVEGTVREPCDVEIGPVSYPTFIRAGQLRQPIGFVRLANTSLAWYTRQCRDGRCGPDGDRPLSPSRGHLVDHVGLVYSDLEPVITHLETAGIPILRDRIRSARRGRS